MSHDLYLVLFDLDGTLMLSGGAGMRGMSRAFRDLYGVENSFEGISPDGKVDPGLFREMAANHDVDLGPDEQTNLDRLRESYTEHLAEEMPKSEAAVLMPGFPELLNRLSGMSGVELGLLTGNYEQTARIKLDRFGLNVYFPFGAFGSDDDIRENLVPLAVARAEEHTGRQIGMGPHVIIVGDTPRDVACGKAHGARTVAVATGSYDVESLLETGADIALQDFSEIEGSIKAILGTE